MLAHWGHGQGKTTGDTEMMHRGRNLKTCKQTEGLLWAVNGWWAASDGGSSEGEVDKMVYGTECCILSWHHQGIIQASNRNRMSWTGSPSPSTVFGYWSETLLFLLQCSWKVVWCNVLVLNHRKMANYWLPDGVNSLKAGLHYATQLHATWGTVAVFRHSNKVPQCRHPRGTACNHIASNIVQPWPFSIASLLATTLPVAFNQ